MGTDVDADAVLTASRALLGVVARSLAPALEEITLPQFRVLVILSADTQPLRSGDLAAALGVHPSTFSRTANRHILTGMRTFALDAGEPGAAELAALGM